MPYENFFSKSSLAVQNSQSTIGHSRSYSDFDKKTVYPAIYQNQKFYDKHMKDTYIGMKTCEKGKDKALDKLIKQIDLKFEGVQKSVWEIESEPESTSRTVSAHDSDHE